jgi:hypothetical protein
MLETLGMESIRRWLPFLASDEELVTYTRNKTLRPATIPETQRELYLEHALLRAGIALLSRNTARPYDYAATTG